MKSFILFIITVIFIFSAISLSSAAERDASAEERKRVAEALSETGCSEVGEIELDGKYFEAEDVVCTEGNYEEILLDQDMTIIKKKLDD